ncbi:MAG: hypothetical protein M0R80_14210 [Proteobacteria bacterium]|jgi:hypothetical protein|nr:hypothetical protein [Pseudomonadota bacterium]
MRILGTFACACLVASFALPALSATYDLTGEWELSTTNNAEVGPCPSEEDTVGTATIEQTGDSFVLTIGDGFVCAPEWVCTYGGTVDGDAYSAANAGTVDDEGGYLQQTLEFTATSADAAAGSGTSVYELDATTCEWTFDFTLERTSGPDADSDSDSDSDADADDGSGSGDGSCSAARIGRGLPSGGAIGLLLAALF